MREYLPNRENMSVSRSRCPEREFPNAPVGFRRSIYRHATRIACTGVHLPAACVAVHAREEVEHEGYV